MALNSPFVFFLTFRFKTRVGVRFYCVHFSYIYTGRRDYSQYDCIFYYKKVSCTSEQRQLEDKDDRAFIICSIIG